MNFSLKPFIFIFATILVMTNMTAQSQPEHNAGTKYLMNETLDVSENFRTSEYSLLPIGW